jgi:hypothetical protein
MRLAGALSPYAAQYSIGIARVILAHFLARVAEWVKAQSADTFKGIFEMQNPAHIAEKAVEKSAQETRRAAVYQAGINHDGALREINAPLTCCSVRHQAE